MATSQAYEVNFDGLVGPTHNYGGLSFGNIASMKYSQSVSNPKAAALQGLEKMQILAKLGIKQAILPPQERPFIPLLKALGYQGSIETILQQVWKENPQLLIACSSASSMWAANAATIAPSADSADGRLHLTPANLISKFHRSFEAPTTAALFKLLFPDPALFTHHTPLHCQDQFADEGAANHTRFCASYSEPGVHLFVFGRYAHSNVLSPQRFPARQTYEASQAIARLHQISPKQVVFAQQNPEAIDAGVFHNDVASVGNQQVFFYHEKAFVNARQLLNELRQKVETLCHTTMHLIEVPENRVSIQEAVNTYLFNSQLLTLPNQEMILLAPTECQESDNVRSYLDDLMRQSHPIKAVQYINVRESMQNGGGPACLRLRIVLNDKQLQSMHAPVMLTEALYQSLKKWIHKYYRDRLTAKDLADPLLLQETRTALDELTQLIELGRFYPFQQ